VALIEHAECLADACRRANVKLELSPFAASDELEKVGLVGWTRVLTSIGLGCNARHIRRALKGGGE
jgi:hypothetical protein